MAKIWLTYAWKDNADADVDHVIARLQSAGLEVGYDRVELLAGRRLWQQIDTAMNAGDVNGWALFVTENSLKSEPCQEEIAIALDRALRTGGTAFPLVGIFPEPIDRVLIPSALATRLYVNLRDPDWAKRVVSGIVAEKPALSVSSPEPFGHTWSTSHDGVVLEVWPRSGRWFPFLVAVPSGEADTIKSVVPGPRGAIPAASMVARGDISSDDGSLKGQIVHHQIDAGTSAHILLRHRPSVIHFGQPDGEMFKIYKNPPREFSIS